MILRSTLRNFALTGSLGVVGFAACGGEPAKETTTSVAAAGCKTDFECAPGKSCADGACADGEGPDDHLAGVIQCVYGEAEKPDDTPADLGDFYVSGRIGGEKVEISRAGGCSISGKTITVVGIGQNKSAVKRVLELYASGADLGAAGVHPLDAYYFSDDEAFDTARSIGLVVDENKVGIAYGLSGKLVVETAATKNGDVLRVRLDMNLARPVANPPKCIGPCTTQADCGAARESDEGMTVPSCQAVVVGGPRECSYFCIDPRGQKGCAAAGGKCGLTCALPRCGAAPPECDPLPTKDSFLCTHCCGAKNGNGFDLFVADLLQTCGCPTSAACAKECKPLCDNAAEYAQLKACSDCLFGTAAKPCRTGVLKKCQADKNCSGYFDCSEACP